MTLKRLVLLVEGDGDRAAVPILVKRLLAEYSAFDAVILDSDPFKMGEYSKISRNDFADWRRLLKAAAQRKNVGGCLLLLDGDSKAAVEGQPFCARSAARRLASEARQVGAGILFSVAVVFACMEFESWLIAGVESLVDKPFSDGRREIPRVDCPVPSSPETTPRDAKGWFRKVMETGYRPTRDQAELTKLVDLNAIRSREMRSFRRLESAVNELTGAIRSGKHMSTPACE